jgi:hypothetical protein
VEGDYFRVRGSSVDTQRSSPFNDYSIEGRKYLRCMKPFDGKYGTRTSFRRRHMCSVDNPVKSSADSYHNSKYSSVVSLILINGLTFGMQAKPLAVWSLSKLGMGKARVYVNGGSTVFALV